MQKAHYGTGGSYFLRLLVYLIKATVRKFFSEISLSTVFFWEPKLLGFDLSKAL